MFPSDNQDEKTLAYKKIEKILKKHENEMGETYPKKLSTREFKIDQKSIHMYEGKTLLYFLCEKKTIFLKLIKLFLENDANPNTKNVFYNTPFYAICKHVDLNESVVDLFIQFGGDLGDGLRGVCSSQNFNQKIFEKFVSCGVTDQQIFESKTFFFF